MELHYAADSLSRLETDADYTAGLAIEVVRRFRRQVQLLWAAHDENDLYAWRSLRVRTVVNDTVMAIPLTDRAELLFSLQGEKRPRRHALLLSIQVPEINRRRA
jgi:plasmid maintenance system killer protein